MAQLERWKANHKATSDNKTNFGSVKSAVKNCESAKRFTKNLIFPQTLVNTGIVNENCESKLRNSEAICENSKAVKNTQGNARSEAKSKYQGKLWVTP